MTAPQNHASGATSMRAVLVVVVVVALGVLAFLNYKQRMDLEKELSKVSLQNSQQQAGNQQQNVEAAKQIVERVKRHYAIPGSVDPTVATIVDVDTLKAHNDFYKLAKNGDHLIITPTRAILYDPDRDIIVDVVPVQLTPQAPASSSSAPAATASSAAAR